MFEAIESVNKVIDKERHFKVLSEDIIGVPIRFELVPINQFLEVKIEKIYLQLKDEVMEKFQSMLINIRNFQAIDCVKSRLINDDYRLKVILFDEMSPLTQQIAEYEKNLQKISSKFFTKAMEALKAYKVAKITAEDLLKVCFIKI
jgi:hypothetical protein